MAENDLERDRVILHHDVRWLGDRPRAGNRWKEPMVCTPGCMRGRGTCQAHSRKVTTARHQRRHDPECRRSGKQPPKCRVQREIHQRRDPNRRCAGDRQYRHCRRLGITNVGGCQVDGGDQPRYPPRRFITSGGTRSPPLGGAVATAEDLVLRTVHSLISSIV